MAFVNVPVDADELPRAADLELEPMAPAYYREVLTQQLITWGIVTIALLIPYLVVTKPEGLRSFLVLAPLLGLVLALMFIPLTSKQARAKAFALRQHDIIYRSGLWWRKTVVLAFVLVCSIAAWLVGSVFTLVLLRWQPAKDSSDMVGQGGPSGEAGTIT